MGLRICMVELRVNLAVKNSHLLQNLNLEFVRTTTPSGSDESLILRLLRQHKFHTGSVIAGELIRDWKREKEAIIKVVPLALDIIDYQKIYDQQVAIRMGVLLNE